MLILRKLRKQKGISQKQLADELGLSESAICLYEKGKRKPNYETILKLAKFYGITADQILKDANNDIDADLISLNETTRKLSAKDRKTLIKMSQLLLDMKGKYNDL